MATEDHTAHSTVESLLKTVPAVHEDESCRKVLENFHEDKKLYALPVVNNKNRPVGMILRLEFTELFSKPYSIELKGKKPISTLMDSTPIIVDIKTSIEDVARIVLDAGIHHMVSGFIVTKDKAYVGMANGYDLLNEITHRKQKHLFGLAHFDQLTGLPNRTLLLDRLNQAISVSNRASRAISLLFIDLDGFKPVNDTYGHAAGDRLLKEVATRMLSCLREGDTAARMGGDEFVVILLESDLDRAILVANRILEVLRVPYELGKKTISSISASIGMAEYPEHADSSDTLLTAADNAMYDAKKNGKDRFAVFTQ
ncbi:cyclic di-GMP phosphodiesterase Gmr [mine drainage metagenome]|uniref:Cyclic di-GMP phosphodiesterase Gmr n=1 Tax=mine drainage metagenome TaxID=410659 RepID=A0A1J5TVU5_9ZZZZ